MADFKTHLTASTVLGIGYGGVAYGMYHVSAPSCVLAAGLCGVSGMLPDIDSGPGRPLREITSFMAAVVPTMLFSRLLNFGLSQESIILVGAAVYVAIRFGLAEFLRLYTVHRGMFHSFVTAAIFGELTYLMLYGDDNAGRWFMAAAVVVGFVSHLLLDELYSVQWDGRPRLKKSFGTAMKFFGEGWWPNLSAYGKFALLTFLVLREPSLVQQLYSGRADQVVQDLKLDIRAHLPASVVSQPHAVADVAPAVLDPINPEVKVRTAGPSSPLPSVEGPVQEHPDQANAAKPLDLDSPDQPLHRTARGKGTLRR